MVRLLDIDENLGLEAHIFLFSTIVLAQLAGSQAHALLFKLDLNTERLAISYEVHNRGAKSISNFIVVAVA